MRNPIGRRLVAAAALVTVVACTASSGPAPASRHFAPPEFDGGTIVLFDGSSWDGWIQRDGSPSQWVVRDDGSVQAAGGDAITKLEFLDCQLHVEFLCPLMEGKAGQGRANSGVYLHGLYEVQVLDSYGLAPAINGCGAVYSVAAPLVNASRPPGSWQSYDIIFRAPRYDEVDALVDLPKVTVLHNGIAVQSHVDVPGPTPSSLDGPMRPMGPIMLQYHGDPIRYRNIWVRRFKLMRVLVVTSVPAETDAIGSPDGVTVVTGGIGRTNAAAAATEAIVRSAGGFDAVLNAGVAGSLPDSALVIGEAVVATTCVYAEEGLATPAGWLDMTGLGFALGDFEGNAVPVDGKLLQRLAQRFRRGPIATVATCSGTDAAAREIVRRTGAIAEAMEGAAVVHAARRLGVPGLELRVISNTTGDRDRQQWDLRGALDALGAAVRTALAALDQG